MGTLTRRVVFVLLFVAAYPAALPRADVPSGAVVSGADLRLVKSALKASDLKRWKKALGLGEKIKDPLLARIIRWTVYGAPNNPASFLEISRFLEDNPGWPQRTLLRRRAEEAMDGKIAPEAVFKWFETEAPIGMDGRLRLAEAILAKGDRTKGRRLIREAWVEGSFGRRQEKSFYRKYRRMLTRGDHLARLDRLLWEGRYWQARRMLWRVNSDQRALAEARLLLRRMRGNVDAAIARVPSQLKDHEGLAYERLRWRLRKGRIDSVLELLDNRQGTPIRPELWWREQTSIIRTFLQKGYVTDAYRLAENHGLTEGGADFAEAEWLAGWIALRFMKEPEIAEKHFRAMFKAVKFPISRSRGAYWTGRALEASGKDGKANEWYLKAAAYPTAYYGQLANERLNERSGADRTLWYPSQPVPNRKDREAFNKNELTRAVRLLQGLGESKRLAPFIHALQGAGTSPGWRILTAALARRSGRPDLAVSIAKKSGREGTQLVSTGFPALIPPPVTDAKGKSLVEVPLVLATIRQESAFYTEAISSAGALGLMQILPNTARKISKKLRIRYSRRGLTDKPDYNLILGQTYLAGLIKEFRGSYVLGLAAYNAGPARVRRWLRAIGDPRGRMGENYIDAIDWIEMIPFDETRNYVQRVLENLQIYRLRLAETEVALSLGDDLERRNDGE